MTCLRADSMDEKTLANFIQLAGLLILENGGETYRAEDTILRVCSAAGYPESEVLAIPTGVFITLIKDGHNCGTFVRRIRRRGINLSRLERVNAICRAYSMGGASLDESLENLKAVQTAIPSSKMRDCFICAGATCVFAWLFGGGFFDGAAAFVCGFCIQLLGAILPRSGAYTFIYSFFGAMLAAALTVGLKSAFGAGNIDKIIVGAILPLLPGLALTNAIRDTMMGDLVSGAARFGEVMLTAVALAAGVGLVLVAYMSLGGVV